VTSLRDVTERERQQAKLREEQRRFDEQVQQAQKLESIAVLAGGVAHDFNNLLLAILGNVELALLHVPGESPAQESLKQVQVAAHNAADLTRQLLAYGGRGRFVVQFLSSYATKPIYVFGGFGLISLFGSAIIFSTMLYLKLAGIRDFVATPLPLVTVMLGLVGCLSILLGLVAELTVRK
jgi:hypothetical protein